MVETARRFLHSPIGWATTFAAAALGIYLLLTHTGHVLLALPYLLLLACPLLHLLGHRHRNGQGHARPRQGS